MKVCTDACIFGASIRSEQATSILDIGTGTGLLSLMLAQRTEANITAIEIDANAFSQAKYNIESSPWFEKISIQNIDIQTFAKNSNQKFDLIISNPPFFQNHLKSDIKSKNVAKHDHTLTFEELARAIECLLSENGKCFLLLPDNESTIFEELLNKYQIYKSSALFIYQKEGKQIFRIINQFKRGFQSEVETQNLIIYKEENVYSDEFIKLLKDYYLNL